MAQQIRANQGLETTLTPGRFYEKSRTRLAERVIQLVRAQAKTLLAHVEDRARIPNRRGQCYAELEHDACSMVVEPLPCLFRNRPYSACELEGKGISWQSLLFWRNDLGP